MSVPSEELETWLCEHVCGCGNVSMHVCLLASSYACCIIMDRQLRSYFLLHLFSHIICVRKAFLLKKLFLTEHLNISLPVFGFFPCLKNKPKKCPSSILLLYFLSSASFCLPCTFSITSFFLFFSA